MEVMLLTGLVVGFSMGCIAGALGVIGFARLNGDAALSREVR